MRKQRFTLKLFICRFSLYYSEFTCECFQEFRLTYSLVLLILFSNVGQRRASETQVPININ